MPDSDAIIRFENVSYAVAGVIILDRLDLEVYRGETLVLLGGSGCGKTTTLKLINRLLKPSAGRVLINGGDEGGDTVSLRRGLGFVMQDAGLFPHFTVADNIAAVPRLNGWDKKRIDERVVEMLELVRLDPRSFRDRYPRELSGGQRQRVGVARALAADPPIILLDEPFGALDALTRAELQEEFIGLTGKLNKTAVFVTHDLREAARVADRIALMEQGKVVLLETPEKFAASDLPLARAYMATV